MNKSDYCPFCHLQSSQKLLFENQSCLVIFDNYPVSPGHLLIIPRRHVANYFNLSIEEQQCLWEMVNQCKLYIENNYHPEGYNIGININESAGQSIPHVHIHLIPRYKGDVPNPRGGVRGVIPQKQNY